MGATKSLGEKKVHTTPRPSPQINDALISNFLNATPLSANLLSLACVLSQAKGKQLSILTFCEAIQSTDVGYFAGYLSCMHGIQLIKRELVADSPRIFKIEWVHDALARETKQYLSDFLSRAYQNQLEIRESWLSKMDKVEALFQ
jgi:hypothetical protein